MLLTYKINFWMSQRFCFLRPSFPPAVKVLCWYYFLFLIHEGCTTPLKKKRSTQSKNTQTKWKLKQKAVNKQEKQKHNCESPETHWKVASRGFTTAVSALCALCAQCAQRGVRYACAIRAMPKALACARHAHNAKRPRRTDATLKIKEEI